MFSDDPPPPPPPPPPQQAALAPAPVASSSSPSDHNSINDEKTDKGETEEVQSKWHGDAAAAPGQPASTAAVDSKRTEVSALSPRVAFLDHQRSLLTLGNSHLKQRIAALAQDKIFKDGDLHYRPKLLSLF
ncbi:basic leucine zipper 2-like [Panicum miliaceum]|uniref:Basic leucine zipper 2-like n=1 Tax=Panicum miliaceum TaxID=4540 RepID=A0A3L6Q401_PANMI|nr:basic leucine zipper 2-like [Panicum miliaceum]